MNTHSNDLELAAAAAILEEQPSADVAIGLQDAEEGFAGVVQEVENISRVIEDTSKTGLSLEGFVRQTFASVSGNDWNRECTKAFGSGVRNILLSSGIEVPADAAAPSFESTAVMTYQEQREESKKRSESILKRLWTFFMNSLESFKNWMKRMFESFGLNAKALRKAAEHLDAKLKTTEQNFASGTLPNTPGWANYLKGVDGRQLKYSEAYDQTRSGLGKVVNAWRDEYEAGLINIAAQLKKGSIVVSDFSTVGNKLKNVQETKLPGGVTIKVQGFGQRHGDEMLAGLKLDVAVDNNVAGLGTVPTLNKTEVADVVTRIKDAAKVIEDGQRTMTNVQRHADDLYKEVKKQVDGKPFSVEHTEHTAPNSASISHWVSVFSAVVTRAGKAHQQLYPLYARVAKNSYHHAMASLAQHAA